MMSTVGTPAEPPTEMEPDTSYEQIAILAYYLWQKRGCPEGSPEEDWFRAEHELLGQSHT